MLLLRSMGSIVWQALVRPGRKMQLGQRVRFGEGELEAEITVRGERGFEHSFESRDARTVGEHMERLGHVPLPPYTLSGKMKLRTVSDIRTVFAKQPGAIAAPTAGLHFTSEILQQIRKRGAEICELTLDVGSETFRPIRRNPWKIT